MDNEITDKKEIMRLLKQDIKNVNYLNIDLLDDADKLWLIKKCRVVSLFKDLSDYVQCKIPIHILLYRYILNVKIGFVLKYINGYKIVDVDGFNFKSKSNFESGLKSC